MVSPLRCVVNGALTPARAWRELTSHADDHGDGQLEAVGLRHGAAEDLVTAIAAARSGQDVEARLGESRQLRSHEREGRGISQRSDQDEACGILAELNRSAQNHRCPDQGAAAAQEGVAGLAGWLAEQYRQ